MTKGSSLTSTRDRKLDKALCHDHTIARGGGREVLTFVAVIGDGDSTTLLGSERSRSRIETRAPQIMNGLDSSESITSAIGHFG